MIAIRCNCRALLSFAAFTAMGFACGGCPPKAIDGDTNFNHVATDAPVNATKEMPAIPKDAQYTIYCRNFTEENRVQDARLAQQQLIATTKFKKWYVVHAADHSTLYYGFYSSIDPHDTKNGVEGQRAIDDQNSIRELVSSEGTRVFPECLLVNIETPDPDANPDWDITRAKGEWSIEIGSFTTVDRKQKAVEAVRQARTEGTEAYYYHGDTASSVCIGCWPADAAVEVTMKDQILDPTAPVVAGNTGFSPDYIRNLEKTGVQTATPQVNIQDITLTSALAKWPEHSTDGYTRTLNAGTSNAKAVERSFLFRIPHRDTVDTMAAAHAAPAPATVAPRKTGPAPGELPSLGY
jgi:hypothetical protein